MQRSVEDARIYAQDAVRAGMEKLSDLIVPSAMTQTIGKVADTLEQITPARRNELRDNVARIARALRPYREALEPLITLEVDPRNVDSRDLPPVAGEKPSAQ